MSKQGMSRTLALCCAILLLCPLLCPVVSVRADEQSFKLAQGNIVIGAEGDGLYVTVGQKRTTLSADTQIVIEGDDTATSHSILVKDHVKANIRLSGVRIESTGFLTAPIELDGAERVTLTLSGANTLNAPQYMAALQVNRYANLIIKGNGSLTARGGISAAGIGGGWKSGVAGAPSGNIQIGGSVSISSFGGDFGAAIGGGEGGSSGQIVITDSAKVYALGGKNAAGIGSGSSARSQNITITSSATVEASGGEGAAGIGCGRGGSASKITVSKQASVRAAGGLGGAALGSGELAAATMVAIGDDAVVRARGGEGAAAIGAGKNSSLSVGVNISGLSSVFAIGGANGAGIGGTSLSAGNVTITDSASVETYGGTGAAGIGSGRGGTLDTVKIDSRANVYAYGGINAAGIGTGENGSFEKLSLSGFATVYALGGKYGAGIGGGKTSVCGQIRVFESAAVTAQGGNFGAGIGTGAKNAPDYAPTAGAIYIYGDASVRAAGGKDAAGVGGGLFASGGLVQVSGTAALDAYDDLTVTVDTTKPEEPADYSIVEAALAKVPKDLSEFTEQSVKILEDTINQIVYDLPSTRQAQVDAYAASVERALSILVKKTVSRALIPAAESFESGSPIVIDWKGATSPKDRIIVLKKGHLPGETELDPAFNVPYGTPYLSAYCTDGEGVLLSEGTATLTLDSTHFLVPLGYAGLPEGEYTAYLCLESAPDTPAALANFVVNNTAMNEADYSDVESAISKIPHDASLYTADSWNALQNAIAAVQYNLPASDQAIVDGYAKAIRDATAALKTKKNTPVEQTRFYTLPNGTQESYTVSTLVHTPESAPSVLLLAQSAGEPETFGWGLIPTRSQNIESTGADSIVSAINHVTVPADIAIGEKDSFDTQGISSNNVGAGAGCTMNGSFSIRDTATINGNIASATVHLEYGASIGKLSYDCVSGESFTLPQNITCPGYIFKGWFTDEALTSPANGTFNVSSNLTFYAKWEVVPVSIQKDFKFSSAALGVAYSDRLQLQVASANFTVSVSSGQLPKGLSLDATTGTVSGTPTDLGTYEFTLLIIDANGTRTEESYSISVFQPVEMTFTFHTSKNEHSGTTGDISFYYTYRDRGTGALKESAPINLTQELGKLNANALKPESVDVLKLSVGAFVGEPVQLFFENTNPEDGYRIDKVVISSPGGDSMPAFEKTYQINAWIGNIDDANFFESGAFVVFIILLIILLIIVGVLLFLRYKSRGSLLPLKKKNGEKKSMQAKKSPTQITKAAAPTTTSRAVKSQATTKSASPAVNSPAAPHAGPSRKRVTTQDTPPKNPS